MKKLVTVLIAFLISSVLSVSHAQSKAGFGLKGGINVASQFTTGEGLNVNVESILRFHGGAYVHYFIFNKIAIQPELMISGKGSKWDDPYTDTEDLLTYVDIPLLIRFQPVKLLNIHAGPQFSYLLSAVQDDISSGEKIDIMDWYNKAEIGIAVGAEANLPLNINLSIRYILGLSEASNDVEYIDPWKNSFIQVSIGYRFMGM
jgi:hypothetical protein